MRRCQQPGLTSYETPVQSSGASVIPQQQPFQFIMKKCQQASLLQALSEKPEKTPDPNIPRRSIRLRKTSLAKKLKQKGCVT